MQNIDEEWREIRDWEGLYEVSNLGRVRSVPREQIRLGKGGKPTPFRYGCKLLKGGRTHVSVVLSDTVNKRQRVASASLLMRETFPEIERGPITEEWRPIREWEGLYEVSNLGRVRSLPRSNIRKAANGKRTQFTYAGRILKPGHHGNGYEIVALCDMTKGRKIRTYRVHRLVCAAFHGPQPPGHEVAHNDNTRDNNDASNLRWATHFDNIQDSVRARTGREAARPR